MCIVFYRWITCMCVIEPVTVHYEWVHYEATWCIVQFMSERCAYSLSVTLTCIFRIKTTYVWHAAITNLVTKPVVLLNIEQFFEWGQLFAGSKYAQYPFFQKIRHHGIFIWSLYEVFTNALNSAFDISAVLRKIWSSKFQLHHTAIFVWANAFHINTAQKLIGFILWSFLEYSFALSRFYVSYYSVSSVIHTRIRILTQGINLHLIIQQQGRTPKRENINWQQLASCFVCKPHVDCVRWIHWLG